MESVTATTFDQARRETGGAILPPKPAARKTEMAVAGHAPVIPDYMREIYHWAYLNPRNVRLLNREFVVRLILWQQHAKLRRAAFAEIEPGQKVLQSTCVYGKYLPMLADHIGPDGHLDLVDIAEVQLQNARRNLRDRSNTRLIHADVMNLDQERYDTVICYFLLHEIPDHHKRIAVDSLLKKLRPGGKFVCIEYHKPHWAHPLKPVTSLVFDTLEPFAKGMWRNEVREFASGSDRYTWHKQTFFGSLFQKVVAQRR